MTRRLGRWLPALLLLGVAALYLFRLGRVALYDDDESVYAEISREMLVLKHWLTPHLDFVPYLEKPPLFYWFNTLAFKALGLSEFSARLTTALAAVAGVGCVYGLGRDLWNRRAGLAAGAVLATSFGYFVFGRMMLPEMLFLVLLTAAFWGFGRTLVDESAPAATVFGGYAAMGGAVMAKGLIGLFPAVAVGAFVLLTRDGRLIRRLKWVRGGALFLLIALPWHLLMAREYPGFLRYYLVDKHLFRFLGHRELLQTTSLPIPTYLAMTAIWFCPWSLFLPAALSRSWPVLRAGDRAGRGLLFVLLWAGAVIGFFALSASRLEYYALPALPALALWVGWLWGGEAAKPREQARAGGLTATWACLIAFALCLAPAAYLFPRLEHRRFYNLFPQVTLPGASAYGQVSRAAQIYEVPGFGRLVPVLETVAAVLVAGTVLSAWAWFRRRPGVAFVCLAGTMSAGLMATERGFALYAPYRSVARLAGVLSQEFRPGEEILVEGRYEEHAGMSFYTGRHVRIYRGSFGVLVYGSRYTGAEGTFVTDHEFSRLWRGPERVYLLSDAPDCLRRLEDLSPQTVVLGRTGNNWLLANRVRAGLLSSARLTAESNPSQFRLWRP